MEPGHRPNVYRQADVGNWAKTVQATIASSEGIIRFRRMPPATTPQRRVPDVTPVFWVTKVVTTALGESMSDFLVHRFDPVVAVALGGVALLVALALQFSTRRYVPWIYWLTVATVAVFGTMVADALHIKFGIPYAVSTAFFAAALVVVFAVWQTAEKTLSIHSIFTARREGFYWSTVIVTFALGTAAGDLTATTLHLGYLKSAVIFAVAIAVPAVARWRWQLNEVVAFWSAYIVTRPLGASIADWLGKPHSVGALGFGDGPVALAFAVALGGLVGYLMVGAGRRNTA
jgi:uncharacterized membrane-anchored protein